MDLFFFDSLGTFSWIVLSVIGLLSAYYYYLTYHFGYLEKQGVPVRKPWPLVGTLNIFKEMKDIDAENYKQFGRFYGVYDSRMPGLHVAEPNLIRQVTIKDFWSFPHARNFPSARGDKIGPNFLVALRGDTWKKARNVITPSFTSGKLKHMTHLVEDCCKLLSTRLEKFAESKKPFNARNIIASLTIEVIASCAFGVEFNLDTKIGQEFLENTSKIFNPPKWVIGVMVLFPKLLKVVSPKIFGHDPMKYFRTLTTEILAAKKKDNKKRKDFLELLLDAEKDAENSTDESTKKVLTEDMIIANSVLFLIAGHETTATTITLALYSIALHPEIQDRLADEVDSVMDRNNDVLTYDAVSEMQYVDMVISETLRMYPPGVRVERHCDEDGYVLNGVKLMKGMVVGIPIYSMHHDPEYYPDPETFDPDRFTPENKAKRDPVLYLPFGSGPRNCVARRFALMEAKMALASIVRKFRIKTCAETKIPMTFVKNTGLLSPTEVMLVIEKRQR